MRAEAEVVDSNGNPSTAYDAALPTEFAGNATLRRPQGHRRRSWTSWACWPRSQDHAPAADLTAIAGALPIEPMLTDQWDARVAPMAPDRHSRRWRWPHPVCAEQAPKHVLLLDARHSGLVRLPSAVVGSPHPGLV
ncbi:hypothetical protein ACLK19_28775 [Escherichia coli]